MESAEILSKTESQSELEDSKKQTGDKRYVVHDKSSASDPENIVAYPKMQRADIWSSEFAPEAKIVQFYVNTANQLRGDRKAGRAQIYLAYASPTGQVLRESIVSEKSTFINNDLASPNTDSSRDVAPSIPSFVLGAGLLNDRHLGVSRRSDSSSRSLCDNERLFWTPSPKIKFSSRNE